jgi:hypothetical protein
MSRRPSRLRTEPPDRQPVLIAGGLIVGIVVALVAVPRLFAGSDPRVEGYVLLASQLHSQGENPVLLRDRLVSVGVANPAGTVLQMAQRYSQSRDRKQQHQAEALETFGKVLMNPQAAAPTPRPTEVVVPTATPQPFPTNTPFVLNAPAQGVPTSAPLGASPTAGAARPAGTPTSGVSSPASGSATAPAGTVQRGRIKPVDGGSARLRKDPSTTGGTLSLIPNAAQVEILETVQGQSIEGESRWLRVRYGNMTGYLWARLVVVGE